MLLLLFYFTLVSFGKRLRRDPIRLKIKHFNDVTEISRASFTPPKISDTPTGMYGITGPSYQDGNAALAKYDLTTGQTTTIQTATGNPLTGESLGCLDSLNGVYYFIYEGYNNKRELISGIYPYDLQNPNTIYNPIELPLIYPNDFVGAGDQCTANPNNGNIFVFGHDNQNLAYQLLLDISFDKSTNAANVKVIGNYSLINDIPLLAGESSIYDSKRDYIWFVGSYGNDSNHVEIDYFYINAKTGEIENKIDYSLVPIDTALYSSKLDKIVGLKTNRVKDGSYFTFSLSYLNPTDLTVNKTFDNIIDNNYCSWEAIYTLDDVGGKYYQLLYKLPNVTESCTQFNGTFVGYLTGVNIMDGTNDVGVPFCEFGSVLTCPWDFEYYNAIQI